MPNATPIDDLESEFPADDYDWINRTFFRQLRESYDIVSDLSGWLNTYSRAAELLPSEPGRLPNLHTYRVDEGTALREHKEGLRALLSKWERREVAYDEFTLCGSATSGSLVTIALLAELGIRSIVFETPAYYATLEHAKLLGMQPIRIPTYVSENFHFAFVRDRFPAAPLAVWITHPRVSLGLNQDLSGCSAIIESLRPGDYLVIDEATEQHFPALLSSVTNHPQVIRIRNFFKPMGLNGPRLCTILHSRKLRQPMEVYTAMCSGPLDCFSLEFAAQAAENPQNFQAMLEVANQQTTQLCHDVDKILRGSGVIASKLANGYIGSAVLDFRPGRGSHADKRIALFDYCRRKRMPIIVGAQMSFAFDPEHEFVRINYFKPRSEIMTGVHLLRDFTLSDQLNEDSAKTR